MVPSPFALERYFARHEFSARHLLSSSDCESRSLADLLALADVECLDLWRALRLGYTESRGHPLLREAIASLHEGLSSERILSVTPSEGIFLSMHALLRAGDRVIVTSPGYQSLHETARSLGCEVVQWLPVEREGGFHFDPEVLADLLRNGADMVIVNFPHNPTGYVPSDAEWSRIVELVSHTGAWFFADEMYRFLGSARTSVTASAYERTVARGGLSKSFGLPGLRQGWVATRSAWALERIAQLKDYTTICGAGPGEILSLIALRNCEGILRENQSVIEANLKAMDSLVAETGGLFTWKCPAGASIGLARLRSPESATRFCERAVEEAGVMLVPSSLFDFGDAHVRIGFGRASFGEGLKALHNWLLDAGYLD